MRSAFVARWEIGPMISGAFEARLALDDEAPFAGHYPGEPILPGTFLIDAVLQAGNAALGGGYRLDEIVSCRFHAPLRPKDVVRARIAIADGEAGSKIVEATVTGRAEAAEITLRLTPARAPRPPVAASRELRPGISWQEAPREGRLRMIDEAFIRRVLPHRFPALLVDGALLFDADTKKPVLLARKAVTSNEPCYAGAREGESLAYPAALAAESFCQACGILRAGSAVPGTPRDPTKVPVLVRLVTLRFSGEVFPGEVLEHRVRLAARVPDGAVFSGESVVAGRVVLQAERVIAATAKRRSTGG